MPVRVSRARDLIPRAVCIWACYIGILHTSPTVENTGEQSASRHRGTGRRMNFERRVDMDSEAEGLLNGFGERRTLSILLAVTKS